MLDFNSSLCYTYYTMKQKFIVSGMSCASCSSSIQSKVAKIEGVRSAVVHLTQNRLIAELTHQDVANTIVKEVTSLGYGIQAQGAKQSVSKSGVKCLKTRLYITTILAVANMVGMFWNMPIYMQCAIGTALLIVGAEQFYRSAFAKIRHGILNMDSLIVLSVSVAYIYSVMGMVQFYVYAEGSHRLYFDSIGMVLTFVLLGKYIEQWAKLKTTDSIRFLEKIQPQEAMVQVGQKWYAKPISEVKKGDVVRVYQDSLVAVDGLVVNGTTTIDESMMTGEPVPVVKSKGDPVYAGTKNVDQNIEVEVLKPNQQTVISQIIERVEDAQLSQPAVQQMVNKVTSIFVPVVIGVAILGACLWWFSSVHQGMQMGFQVLMTVLIIACPCALGLATPTAIAIAVGRAADHGLLIKNIDTLSRFRQIDTIVLDKTNTLTQGKPSVQHIEYKGEVYYSAQVLYGLTLSSTHPLSVGISSYFEQKNIVPIMPQLSANHPGKGLAARVDDHNVLLGSKLFLNDFGVDVSEVNESSSSTQVFLAIEGKLMAVVYLEDELKPDSVQIINILKEKGLDVHLLSGDRKEVVQKIAKKLNIAHYKSNVLPQEKGMYIARLKEQSRVVSMIGDGVNDAEALTKSDLGIAMGNGSELAIHSSDITVIHSKLRAILQAMKLAQQTHICINQNLFWAFIYNIIMIPVAMGALYWVTGYLMSPTLAAIAMTCSSISVVLNSLRYRYKSL